MNSIKWSTERLYENRGHLDHEIICEKVIEAFRHKGSVVTKMLYKEFYKIAIKDAGMGNVPPNMKTVTNDEQKQGDKGMTMMPRPPILTIYKPITTSQTGERKVTGMISERTAKGTWYSTP